MEAASTGVTREARNKPTKFSRYLLRQGFVFGDFWTYNLKVIIFLPTNLIPNVSLRNFVAS